MTAKRMRGRSGMAHGMRIAVAAAAVAAGMSPVAARAAASTDPFELYTLGRSFYAQGEFDTAAALFSKTATVAPKELEGDAFYNLGNAHFKNAERQKDENVSVALESLRLALAAYRESLDRQPGARDAQYNLELGQRLMKYLLDKLKNQQEEMKKNQGRQKNQNGDTGMSQSKADTSSTGGQQGQPGENRPPKDNSGPVDRQTAERDLKDRMKDIEKLKQKLFQAARQKGIDPQNQQEQPDGAIVGGGYKDW